MIKDIKNFIKLTVKYFSNIDMMFYTSSDDGTIKFWNTDKLANQTLPKFDHVEYTISKISCGGANSQQTVAVTSGPSSR